MPTVARYLAELGPRPIIPCTGDPEHSGRSCLHLGESPFAPLPRVQDALRETASQVNAYPDSSCRRVREKLAEYHPGLDPGQFVCGNGSDELIDLVTLTYAGGSGRVLSFDPTFFVYQACTRRHGAHYASIPRDAKNDFAFPEAEQLTRGLVAHRPQVIFLANPNNPTGTLTPRKRIRELLNATQVEALVVVDECYFDFCGESVIDLLPDAPNLLILRSLSKSGSMAGLRFGYAIGNREMIESLERAALIFPVNAMAQAGAVAALESAEEIRLRAETIVRERERLAAMLRELGLHVASSAANLLLVASGDGVLPNESGRLLAERGILVSDQTHALDLGRTVLRIGIGTEQDSDRVVTALRDMIEMSPNGE